MKFLPFLPLLAAFTAHAADAPWKWQDSLVPDVGIDLDAAQIVRVTSLGVKGDGTLRDALKVKGPKIIVFEVGGVIDLDLQPVSLDEPDCFVAGQTAPPPGITIIRGGLRLRGDRTVLQHLRVRPGDAGQPKKSGWEPDGISTSGGPQDVWVDHCSSTWSIDEAISASTYKSPNGEPLRRMVIRHCIAGPGLDNATHAKGPHAKGTLVFGGSQHVAIVGNLYTSNVERNPVFQPGTSGVVVNNVIANPGQRAIHAHSADPDLGKQGPNSRIAVVGNVVLFGEKTKKTAAVFEGTADGYFKDNEGYNWLGEAIPQLREPVTPTVSEPPVWPEGLKPVSTTAALWYVARFAGARPAERDPIDTRIVQEAITGTAKIIDSQEEVGGYPKLEPTTRKLEVPDKNRRDWLEKLAREVTFGSAPAKAEK